MRIRAVTGAVRGKKVSTLVTSDSGAHSTSDSAYSGTNTARTTPPNAAPASLAVGDTAPMATSRPVSSR